MNSAESLKVWKKYQKIVNIKKYTRQIADNVLQYTCCVPEYGDESETGDMKEKRINIGYVVDQLSAEMLEELKDIMGEKNYNLNGSLLKRAVQMSVCRGIEEGMNLSAYYTPARCRPGYSFRGHAKEV